MPAVVNTDALFDELLKLLQYLRGELTRRRNRDRACTSLTDGFVLFEEIGRRLQLIEWDPGRVAAEEEEEDAASQEEAGQVSLWELMAGMPSLEEEIQAQEQSLGVDELRLYYFRLLLDYFCTGCRNPEDVTRKILAIARRVRPKILEQFGMSQVDVSIRLGERRATVSAREKRLVEAPLKQAGAKGYHLLGGVKTEHHREACRRAQKGNTNRADGEARKRRAGGG